MSVSQDFVNKYSASAIGNADALGFGDKLAETLGQTDDYLVSTLTDVGTSLWNSIIAVPKLLGANTDDYRVETHDLLRAVNEDYAAYYTRSKETVEASSFIAGTLLPAGVALKGMKMLQAGKLGFYPTVLSDARQAARLSELEALLEGGGQATTQYRNLRWSVLAANAGQETMQAAGMELAVMSTLSEHAWMEDYWKNPVANFSLSLGIGGVIGSGLGQIAIRNTMAERLGAVATKSVDKSLQRVVDIPLGTSDVDKMQRFTLNAQTLRALAENPAETQLTRDIASTFATRWEGMVGELEQTSVFGDLLKKTEAIDAKKQARDIILTDAAFGANRVEFATFEEKQFMLQRARGGEFFTSSAKEAATKYGELGDMGNTMRASLVASEAIKLLKPNWAELMEEQFKIMYSPYHKAWVPISQTHNYVRAVDTGKTTYAIRNVKRPNGESFAEFGAREIPTSKADAYWIDTLGSVAQTSIERDVNIVASDIGLQNAWLSRLQGLATEGKSLPNIKLIADTGVDKTIGDILKTGRSITLDDLEANLATQKTIQVKRLLTEGASTQEIGIRLNMPTETVERLLLERKPLQELGNWRLYTNAGAIDSEYLAQTSRSLEFTTNGNRVASLAYRNADASAILDNKFIRQQNKELMADTIASSNSQVLQQFYRVLDNDTKHWEIFSQQLANIVNEKAGSFFFSSGDFASRRMGDISAIAATKGQAWVGVVNNVSQEMLTPLSARVRTQTLTQVGLTEFNEVVNSLQALSGYRDIDPITGKLFRSVEIAPDVFIRDVVRNSRGEVIELSENMTALLKEASKVGREMYNFKNGLNKIQGFKDMKDIGLHLPVFNPINKFISYVIDTQATGEAGSRVKLLAAQTPEKLADLERDWITKYGKATGRDKRYHLVTKSQQEDYNFWQMRMDPIEMDLADISKFHSGSSASALPIFDDSYARTLIESLHNRVIYYGRKTQELYLDDIMHSLDSMSAMNQKYTAGQPTAVKNVGLAQKEDAARAIKNMLLGNNQLDNFSTWKMVNNNVSNMVEWSSRKIQEAYRANFVEQVGKDGTVSLREKDFVKYNNELESLGLKNPFKDFNDYMLARDETLSNSKDFSKQYANQKSLDAFIEQHREEFDKLIQEDTAKRQAKSKVEALPVDSVEKVTQKLVLKYGQDLPADLKAAVDEAGGLAKMQDSFYGAAEIQREQRGLAGSVKDADEWRTQSIARKHGISYNSAEQLIAAGNGVLATLALRVLETGQAVVTALSWPIMTLAEVSRALPKTFIGNALGEGVEAAFPARAIYDGIRFRHSDAAKPLIKKWIDEGFGKSIVSEASRINELLTTGGKGAVGKINSILESGVIKKMSFLSDFSEGESRLWILSTGFQLARRMYPGISTADADIFARQFMLKSVGNYYSAQRPAMFQGTFGVAIGLFQTYMLSYAQSMYRSIENREFKALAQQMLSQQALFGMGSEPLYDVFSKTIGEHFSDKHYDLTTGTYRALPHGIAEYVAYGLPASLGIGLYTRGDMQPRLPFTQENPLDTIAAINASRQIIGASYHTIQKVLEANGMNAKFRGLMEGFAMQSISRPLARIVEATPVPDGQGGFEAVGSVSREGNTISTSPEIWSGPGLSSRLLASRSSEEQIKREADYLNSFYGAIDFANRKKVTESLKTSIRAGSLDDETMTKSAKEYLRTGSSTGWNAALNEALATSEGGIDYKLGKRLRPDSPLQKMVKDNF